MITSTAAAKKTYIRIPPLRPMTGLHTFERAVVGGALSPLYWIWAHRYRLPGLQFPVASAKLGLRSLLRKNRNLSLAEIYRMIFWPVESTRYFEFGLAWRFLSDLPIERYLDVSSPRLFPLSLLIARKQATAEIMNPDRRDLEITASLLKACGLENRGRVSSCLIEDARFEPGSFDAITSISVVEHIPQDSEAVRKMWELLVPGGRLVLSMPCAAVAEEQYVDVDHFGVQSPEKDGFIFMQHVYDEASLQERFYSLLGVPARRAIFGEKQPGSLRHGLLRKWSGGKYPKWKEPYLMARGFQAYSSLGELPGEGVIIMEFVKP